MSVRRVLRMKIFLGSTIEEIEAAVAEFLGRENLCVGNYVDVKLHKLGNVYQLVLPYAQVIESKEVS